MTPPLSPTPQVYGVEWNPYEGQNGAQAAFLTFGRKHIKLWTADATGTNYTSKQLSFGGWLPGAEGREGRRIA